MEDGLRLHVRSESQGREEERWRVAELIRKGAGRGRQCRCCTPAGVHAKHIVLYMSAGGFGSAQAVLCQAKGIMVPSSTIGKHPTGAVLTVLEPIQATVSRPVCLQQHPPASPEVFPFPTCLPAFQFCLPILQPIPTVVVLSTHPCRHQGPSSPTSSGIPLSGALLTVPKPTTVDCGTPRTSLDTDSDSTGKHPRSLTSPDLPHPTGPDSTPSRLQRPPLKPCWLTAGRRPAGGWCCAGQGRSSWRQQRKSF
jgi:hypothetical protein